MMKHFLVIAVLIFSIGIVAYGDIEFRLDASASSDDGHIVSYRWFKWNENTQSLDYINYINWGPEDPDHYYVYNAKDDTLISVEDSPVAKVMLSVGIHYFALNVVDNGGLVSGIFNSNRLSLNPNDEWITVTVVPRLNIPPIIVAEAQMRKQRDMLLLWKKQLLLFLENILNS